MCKYKLHNFKIYTYEILNSWMRVAGDGWQEYRNAIRTFVKTSRQCLFSIRTEKIAACREGKRCEWCCLLPRLHELTYQRRNLICFGIKREVSCVEYVDLRVRYVLAVAFRLAEIEREVVLAPEH